MAFVVKCEWKRSPTSAFPRRGRTVERSSKFMFVGFVGRHGAGREFRDREPFAHQRARAGRITARRFKSGLVSTQSHRVAKTPLHFRKAKFFLPAAPEPGFIFHFFLANLGLIYANEAEGRFSDQPHQPSASLLLINLVNKFDFGWLFR